VSLKPLPDGFQTFRTKLGTILSESAAPQNEDKRVLPALSAADGNINYNVASGARLTVLDDKLDFHLNASL
jgi:hypothetical protein